MIYGLYQNVRSGVMSGLVRSAPGAVFSAICAVILLGNLPSLAAQRVMLAWDPSPDASVTGYHVYRGVGPAPVFDAIDVGASNTCELTDLYEGETYQFYVTAYDAMGIESEPSNTLVFAVPLRPLSPLVTRDSAGRPAMRMKVAALPGKRVALETSTDLVNWVRLSTSTDGGAVDMTVLVSPSQPQRFFRTTLAK